jgi:hypothetical protein
MPDILRVLISTRVAFFWSGSGMREAVFWDLAGVTSTGAAGGDITLVICEKLVGRGREKLAGDGLCGRDASKISLAELEDPETSGPVLCDLSVGEEVLGGVVRELLRGGCTRLALSEAPMSGVWHCVSCQDVSGDSGSSATSDVVM